MADQRPMTDEELLDLIARMERASLGSSVAAGATVGTSYSGTGSQMTTLEIDRFDALNAYYARPMGNEVENRSQIVLPELRDTIEWIMPQIMRMFVASKNVCRFDPENPNDSKQVEIETQVVNDVFLKQNNGFFVLHDFFKDALLLRNGYVKIYWTVDKQTNTERYTGLNETELTELLHEDDEEKIEVLEQREYQQHIVDPLALAAMPPPAPGAPPPQPPPPVTLFDIKIRRTSDKGRVCVECVPPEEMLVSPRTRGNLDDSPFSAHKATRTRSDLIAEGYDSAIVNTMQPGRPNWLEIDALARDIVADQMQVDNPSDRAMQEIEVRDVTMRVDYDGDGVAELRRVLIGGDKILENEEIEEVPLASCTPVRMPHRHTGLSFYDLLADLQVLKSMLWRQGIDNLAIANNTRIGVDWQNCNVDDLLTSRPGGVIRTRGAPQNVLFPIETPSNLITQVIPAIQYCDSQREMRTGVGRDTMGLDADALQNVTKGGQLAAMSAASLKIELVARMLAEGVKDIFTKIHGLLIRHQDKPLQFEMSGQWLTVDPSQWRKRERVSVNVGLGSGNRDEAKANLMMLGQMQQQVAPLGLIGPKQAYATFKTGVELLGYQNPERFAMDPESPEYQQWKAQQPPPQPPPQIAVAQIRAQSEQQKAQAKSQSDAIQAQREVATAQLQAQSARERAQAEIAHAALQGGAERDTQIAETLIKVIGQIVAQQLKQNAAADAGQMVAHDYQELSGVVR